MQEKSQKGTTQWYGPSYFFDLLVLLCTESAYYGPWNPVSFGLSQNPNERQRNMMDHTVGWYLFDFFPAPRLKCMAQRKQFEFARHSEEGKGHLKNCKAEPRATQLTGTCPTSFRALVWSETLFALWKARRQPCLLDKHQATKGRGRAHNHDLDIV